MTTGRRRGGCAQLLWRTVRSQWSIRFLGVLAVIITLHKAMEMVAPSHPSFRAGLRFFDAYLALPMLAAIFLVYVATCFVLWVRDIDDRLAPVRTRHPLQTLAEFATVDADGLLADCSRVASAPASVFLFGEHAVMAGHPAVCLPIPKRVHVGVTFTNRAHGLRIRLTAPSPDTGLLAEEQDLEAMYVEPL